MLSSSLLKRSKQNYPKVIGRKLLHTVTKVKNSIFLSLFQFFADNFFRISKKNFSLVILALFENFGVTRGRNGSKKRKKYFVNVS
jgi:hypothetical protein